MKRLQQRCQIGNITSEVFAVRLSSDGASVATGCNDGAVRVYDSTSGEIQYTLTGAPGPDALPITALRYRPVGASKTKNVLLAAGCDGTVRHWHVPSSKCISKITEPGNQIYAADYRADGYFFATAGKDKLVRLYDEASRTLVASLTGSHSESTPGHSNRVFAVKFDPHDDNIVVSGGWDNTIQIHDIRVGGSVRSIYGPHICGDAIDLASDGVLLTGSWRPDEQLQLWDLGSGRLMSSLAWNGGGGSGAGASAAPPAPGKARGGLPAGTQLSGDGESPRAPPAAARATPCMLYAASFSHDAAGSLIAAGGSGANEARVFDRSAWLRTAAATSSSSPSASSAAAASSSSANAAAEAPPAHIATITGLPRAVFSLDWHEASSLVIGGGDGPIRVFDVAEGSAAGGRAEREFNDAASVSTTTQQSVRDRARDAANEAQLIDVRASAPRSGSIGTAASSIF